MGRSFFLRSGWGQRALRVARQMFAKAIEIDPRYARAHAGIANCDSYLVCMGDPGASFEEILADQRTRPGARPRPGRGACREGAGALHGRPAWRGECGLDEAVRLGPTLFEAHFFAAATVAPRAAMPRRPRCCERAAELQPDDFRALGLAVNAYRSLGRRDDLLSAARRCLERVEAEVAVHPDNAGALAFGAAVLAELGEAAIR